MKFEEKLILLRKKNGLSQEDLAEKLGVSRQAISRWEMGSTMPDAPNLLNIGRLFNVSIDYLLHDEYDSDNDIPIVKEVKATITRKEKKNNTQNLVTSIIWYVGSICFLLAGWIGNNFAFTVVALLYFICASGFLTRYIKGKSDKKERP